jgi:short-subunit dehydrogenase
MKSLAGKKALITGAAAGIGRAIALALARQGVDLYLVDLNEHDLNEVVAEASRHGVEAIARRCDVGCDKDVSATVGAVLDAWGELDILVNNAGIAHYGPTEKMTGAQWDRLLAINLLAPIQFTRELLPTLLSRPEAHVLNVCSIAGLVALPKLTAYQVSKFGLVGFSESLRAEYGRSGLGVTALCPGFVKTGLLRRAIAGSRSKRACARSPLLCTTPEKVGAKAVSAIRRNRGIVIVTPFARLAWFLKRMTPGGFALLARLRKKSKSGRPAEAIAEVPVPSVDEVRRAA